MDLIYNIIILEILKIYLTCRDEKEIEEKFDELIEASAEAREDKFKKAQDIILKEFDEEVQNKLKALGNQLDISISETEAMVRDIVLSEFDGKYHYEDELFRITEDVNYLERNNPYSFNFLPDPYSSDGTKSPFPLFKISA